MLQRRDILRSCLRGGGLLALGGIAAVLGWRNPRGACPRTHPCGGCPLFDGCNLPKALLSPPPGAARSNNHPRSPHA